MFVCIRRLERKAAGRGSRSDDDENYKLSRAVFDRAKAYSLAYVVSWGPFIISTLIYTYPDVPMWNVYLVTVFVPLQGVFSLLVYMYPRAKFAKAMMGDDCSWLRACTIALWWTGPLQDKLTFDDADATFIPDPGFDDPEEAPTSADKVEATVDLDADDDRPSPLPLSLDEELLERGGAEKDSRGLTSSITSRESVVMEAEVELANDTPSYPEINRRVYDEEEQDMHEFLGVPIARQLAEEDCEDCLPAQLPPIRDEDIPPHIFEELGVAVATFESFTPATGQEEATEKRLARIGQRMSRVGLIVPRETAVDESNSQEED
mmetsp:Transcript_31538/g.75326  ORF Transcript_31538/g.75326 Transcript_31538/m.75326 type:complete len:320 (-) Transcript_31538:77-1036(-)